MVMGTPCSGPHICLRARARSAARARLRAPSTSMAMMALRDGLCLSTRSRYRSRSSRHPIFFRRMSAASSLAVRNGVASMGVSLPPLAHVDLDLLGGEKSVVVRIGGGEVLVHRVEEFGQADHTVGLVAEEVSRLGRHHGQFLHREIAVLVGVAEEEGLDHCLMELLAVDPPVAVLVVLLHPGFSIGWRRGLGEHTTDEHEGP